MDHKRHIEGIKKGSYEDFRVLYDAFSGNLYGFIFNLTRSHSKTQEIVQETFMRVWIHREKLDPDASFKSYLFTISHNLIIDTFRKQLKKPSFDNYLDYCEEVRESGNDIEAQIDFDLFNKQLDAAKEKLTPRQRETFELAKERGIAPAEIAQMMGVTEQTVYNQLSSALKRLKKELGPIATMLTILLY